MNNTNNKFQQKSKYLNPIESLSQANKGTITPEQQQMLQKAAENNTEQQSTKQESFTAGNFNREFTLFSRVSHIESYDNPKKVTELMGQITETVKAIKARSQEVNQQVIEIEKQVLQTPPEKGSKYHVYFLEVLLNLLKGIYARVGETKTWLNALISRKQKRGSIFASRSKSKGTQYSLSQELQSARSVM